jgi:hypothetical protein
MNHRFCRAHWQRQMQPDPLGHQRQLMPPELEKVTDPWRFG